MIIVIAFISGFLMSLGLIVSSMVNPKKVIGFLDIFGKFDPTLFFVMAGALCVTMIGFYGVKRFKKPMCATSFDKPSQNKIDMALIVGAALFGIGWALAGFCPGPALVGVGFGIQKIWVFSTVMVAAMFATRQIIDAQKEKK